jgi:hypothetical protein
MSLFDKRYCRGCIVFRYMCISKTVYKTILWARSVLQPVPEDGTRKHSETEET